MQVENFDTVANAIHRNGGREAMAKFAVPGRCWQGYFLDTEGNTFGCLRGRPERMLKPRALVLPNLCVYR